MPFVICGALEVSSPCLPLYPGVTIGGLPAILLEQETAASEQTEMEGPSTPGSGDALPAYEFGRLESVIVRVTTWVSTAFLVLLLILGLVSGDEKFFIRAINPVGPAVAGLWMLAIGRPRAIVQLAAGSVGVALSAGLFDVDAREGALLGLLSMGVVGALLVHRHALIFLATTATGLFAVAVWWADPALSGRDRVAEAIAPPLAFLFTAGLVVWLQRELRRETEQRRAASHALAASEEQFRTAFEVSAATMALVGLDDYRLLEVNAAGCEMLGRSEEEVTNLVIADIVHPEDWAIGRERIAELVSGEIDSIRATIRYVPKDGSIAFGLLSAALVREATGAPRHLVAHLVDTTDQHVAEQRLTDLLASRDELIASVSHELRTPLTAVLGYAGLLVEAGPGPPPEGYSDMVGEIFNQGSDLVGIIEDLLVFAQSDSETMRTNPQSTEIQNEIEAVIETLRSESSAARIETRGPRVNALADPLRVRQILRNLLSNAMRYGGDSVVVETMNHGEAAFVVVSDNGNGIPHDDRERIFEPYQRSQPEDGLTAAIGVGLTVALRLARLMDGDLTYEYEAGFSRFTLTLPSAGTLVPVSPTSPSRLESDRRRPATRSGNL